MKAKNTVIAPTGRFPAVTFHRHGGDWVGREAEIELAKPENYGGGEIVVKF